MPPVTILLKYLCFGQTTRKVRDDKILHFRYSLCLGKDSKKEGGGEGSATDHFPLRENKK